MHEKVTFALENLEIIENNNVSMRFCVLFDQIDEKKKQKKCYEN